MTAKTSESRAAKSAASFRDTKAPRRHADAKPEAGRSTSRSEGRSGRDRGPAGLASSPSLERALARDPEARAQWQKLAPSHRKEYLVWITSAKHVETAERRLALAIEKLRTGVKTPMRANDAPAVSAAPFAKKLGIKPDMRVVVIAAPDTDRPSVDGCASSGVGDVVLAFARDTKELARIAPRAVAALAPGAALWIAYRKKARGVESDLSRDHGWDAVTGSGWQAVSLVAIDPTWSAVRFRNDRR
jgi:hypothetical protein